ncbi:unnamed protein product [Leptidea sinapis]|uniref:Sushi domain-containing protein n=1 Tax=Leptidea sinapis TaxID=189913 RepID=A0A5E4QR95_9NEOP|nr:unnamed protein product [Leptidea sinapis]
MSTLYRGTVSSPRRRECISADYGVQTPAASAQRLSSQVGERKLAPSAATLRTHLASITTFLASPPPHTERRTPAVVSVASGQAVCRFPGAPAHSRVSLSEEGLAEGAVASYSCERGFELLGPARRLCGADGRWTPDGIPFCGEYSLAEPAHRGG